MDFGLADQQVVIVGGNRGIGLEIAKGFQDQGSRVTITSEHPSVFDAQSELNARGGPEVEAIQFDITSHEEVSAAFGRLGCIDVLINNSGVFWETPTYDRSAKNYDVFVKQLYWRSRARLPTGHSSWPSRRGTCPIMVLKARGGRWSLPASWPAWPAYDFG